MDMKTSLPTHIFRTNHIPSPEERDLIRSLILLHQERSLALDGQIERAEAALHDLHLERQVQRNVLQAHQALLTPMRRLIPDILLEIFRHCHDDARDAPMQLARVCKQWRELALSNAALWTVVTLHGALPTARIVPLARACAERSGSCDLRVLVSFMNRRHDMGRVRRALLKALQILAQHSHRWRSFEVLMHKAYKPEGNEMTVAAAPRLEKLVWVIDDVQAPLPFSSFPNLRDLRLSMLHPSDIPLVLKCTKLRNFIAPGAQGELTLVDCWSILSNCPCLETFDVSSIKASREDVTQKGMITLPHLRELRIGPYVSDPASLVHCLNTPSLTKLRLLVGKTMEFDSSCVLRLVHECRPPLRSLSLVNTNSADIAACLPLLPHLKSLLIQHSNTVDFIILRLLERDSTGSFICPDLKHLGFRLCLFTGSRLVELARTRRAMAGGLRVLTDDGLRYREGGFNGLTVELKLVGEFTDAELEELRDLQAVGTSSESDMGLP